MDERRLRILVIHDEQSVLEFFKALLSREGYFVRGVQRADQGRELFARMQPDLVIVNGSLPDGTGLELLAEFKKARPTVVVIYESGAMTTEKSQQALDLGAVAALALPLKPAQLLTIISEALTSRS